MKKRDYLGRNYSIGQKALFRGFLLAAASLCTTSHIAEAETYTPPTVDSLLADANANRPVPGLGIHVDSDFSVLQQMKKQAARIFGPQALPPLPIARPHLASDAAPKLKIKIKIKIVTPIAAAQPKQKTKWSDAEIRKAIEDAAAATGLKFSKLQTVAMMESFSDPTRDGKGQDGKVVAHGLMQITTNTMFGILRDHKDEVKSYLSKYGPRFAPVINWVNGDHSVATDKAVQKAMYDPVFSAYVGALYYKDLGAASDAEGAYLKYVIPKLGYTLTKLNAAAKKMTAAQLAKVLKIQPSMVNNNPIVFGPHGKWTVAEVIANNHKRFNEIESSLSTEVADADAPVRSSWSRVRISSFGYSGADLV